MHRRSSIPLLVVLLAIASSLSCSSDEREARSLLIQSNAYLREGRSVELVDHLKMITSEYPETEGADVARQMLAKALEGNDRVAENVLKVAWAAAQIFFIEEPNGTLDMRALRTHGFEGNPEVIVSIPGGTSWDLTITAHHLAGGTLFSVGFNGQVRREENPPPSNHS
jgi:hypothetical protein